MTCGLYSIKNKKNRKKKRKVVPKCLVGLLGLVGGGGLIPH